MKTKQILFPSAGSEWINWFPGENWLVLRKFSIMAVSWWGHNSCCLETKNKEIHSAEFKNSRTWKLNENVLTGASAQTQTFVKRTCFIHRTSALISWNCSLNDVCQPAAVHLCLSTDTVWSTANKHWRSIWNLCRHNCSWSYLMTPPHVFRYTAVTQTSSDTTTFMIWCSSIGLCSWNISDEETEDCRDDYRNNIHQ